MIHGRKASRLFRVATILGVSGILLVMMGDSPFAAGSARGIDPLQVLDLSVKPNVIIVLDSSGSMQGAVGGTDQGSGDHPRSKLYLAKQVLKTVIQRNSNKVTFLFGQYTQDHYNPDVPPPADPSQATSTTGSRLQNRAAGNDRFRYSTNNIAYPTMTASLQILQTETDTTGRGLQNWQDIRAGWNQLYYREGAVVCAATIPSAFYPTGEALAAAMQTAMNGCGGRGATPNNYFVTFAGGTGRFTFGRCTGANAPVAGCTAGGNNNFELRWADTPNNIAGALSRNGSGNTGLGTGSVTSGNSLRLLRGPTSNLAETFDANGDGTADSVTTYTMMAGRFFNGEAFTVTSGGLLCNMTTGAATVPPSFTVTPLDTATCAGGTAQTPVTFTFAGGNFTGNTLTCNGFDAKVPLVPCDATQGQLTLMEPFLDNEIPFTAAGGLKNYVELQDGTFAVDDNARPVPGGGSSIKADGNTPIAPSLRNIKTLFTGLWNTGQAVPFVSAIKNHQTPRERTIVVFVTDGDDTCANADSTSTSDRAKAAALAAQALYTPVDPTDPVASSVATYMVGFGNGAQVNQLNWIAYGGSGLGQGTPVANTVAANVRQWTESGTSIETKGADPKTCPTCIPAFIAPDEKTLSDVLESIIDQGASSGEFTTQAGLVENVYEYTKEILPAGAYDPNNPTTRYRGIVPMLFDASFTLPNYKGDVRGITNDAGSSLVRWSAGQALLDLVVKGPGNSNTGTQTCGDNGVPNSGQCSFPTLTGKIQRRIFTTSRNGVFPTTIANYFDAIWLRGAGNRAILWPPVPDVDPAAGTVGAFDSAWAITPALTTFAALQSEFGACNGTPLPGNCAVAGATQLNQAIKEARQMILAFMAGAETMLDSSGNPVRIASGSGAGEILYKARSWALAESTLADEAVAPPPLSTEVSPKSTGWGLEYDLMAEGPRDSSSPAHAANGTDVGLGLRDPDADGFSASDPTLKPVMTMLYFPANDMLHAFRAGPSVASASKTCTASSTVDCGGEELWGFVPYDQLLNLRMRMRPQTRSNHTYMMSSSVRFAEIFVPNTGTTGNYDATTLTHGVGGVTTPAMLGVWRRILWLGRGPGGKYVTVLDVTSPGPFTRTTKDIANSIVPPIPLWSRGNPDTQDGSVGGTLNNDAADAAAYLAMGETWSTPSVSMVDPLPSARKPCTGGGADTAGNACVTPNGSGVSFAMFMGSGFGGAGEGTTLFTLDALTGDVVATADFGSRSPAPTDIDGQPYANAIVASPSLYQKDLFVRKFATHPSATKATRLYVGDLHGRLWKVLPRHPSQAILFADLGKDQPIATGASLGAFPAGSTGKPHIYVTTGNDFRAEPDTSVGGTGSFLNVGFRDDVVSDDDLTPTAVPSIAGCAVLSPVLPCLFSQTFLDEAGNPGLFRGTIQPAVVLNENDQLRVFFGGTLFVPPPPGPRTTPGPTTGGGANANCTSRFDSEVFALAGVGGEAGFDLTGNTGAAQSYVVFTKSRIGSITIEQDPSTFGASLRLGETIRGTGGGGGGGGGGGLPPPPPPGGAKPTASQTVTSRGGMMMSSGVCRQ